MQLYLQALRKLTNSALSAGTRTVPTVLSFGEVQVHSHS